MNLRRKKLKRIFLIMSDPSLKIRSLKTSRKLTNMTIFGRGRVIPFVLPSSEIQKK